MAGSRIGKSTFGLQIVYAVRIGAGRVGRNKIMIRHRRAFLLLVPLFSPVLIDSQYLFLLDIDRNYRIFALECFFRQPLYVLKLRVPVRVVDIPLLLTFRLPCIRYPGRLSVLLSGSGLP
jgi:hypothetical protein